MYVCQSLFKSGIAYHLAVSTKHLGLHTSFITVVWPTGEPALKNKPSLQTLVVVCDILTAESAARANNELRDMLTLPDLQSAAAVRFKILRHSP